MYLACFWAQWRSASRVPSLDGTSMVLLVLLVLAFSIFPGMPWIVPVLASVPFSMGTYFIFMSLFTYIVVAYWLLAVSTLAWNTTMRMAFAAAFLLFARWVVPCSQHCRCDAALGWADDYYDTTSYVHLYHNPLLSPSATSTIATTHHHHHPHCCFQM